MSNLNFSRHRFNTVNSSMAASSVLSLVGGSLLGSSGAALALLLSPVVALVIFLRFTKHKRPIWKKAVIAMAISGSSVFISLASGLMGYWWVYSRLHPEAFAKETNEASVKSDKENEELSLLLKELQGLRIKPDELPLFCRTSITCLSSHLQSARQLDSQSSETVAKALSLSRESRHSSKLIELLSSHYKKVKTREDLIARAERNRQRAESAVVQTRINGIAYIKSGMSSLNEAALLGDSDPIKACRRVREGVRLIEKAHRIDPGLAYETDYARTEELLSEFKRICGL